jgi:hypothetical protein
LARSRALVRRLRPMLHHVPWAFVLLLAGTLTAVLAVYLTFEQAAGNFLAFIVAALLLLGGLVSLVVQNMREGRPRPGAEEPREAAIYGKTTCSIDSTLLQRLAQATRNLHESIREKGWQFDDAAFQVHLTAAQRANEQGHARAAFAEECRALLVLMEVVHQRRGRGESFNPLWDAPSD